VEGFLYQSKQSRVDKDTNTPLRPDLGARSAGQAMVRQYLLERYSQDYDYRLKQMAGEEREQLCKELIDGLLRASSITDFIALFSNGVTRGAITFKIENSLSQGCLDLHGALLENDREVPLRAEKLQVFYTGEDSECNTVWNGGNMFRTSYSPLKELLTSSGKEAIFAYIMERFNAKKSHVYRGDHSSCNRHGHSNDLPSYFAFGHDSLLSYLETSSQEAWVEYRGKHAMCCGVCSILEEAQRYVAKKARTAERLDFEVAQERLLTVIAELRDA